MKGTLRKGRRFGEYKVESFIKVSGLDNVESYMLVAEDGSRALLKLVVDGCGGLEFDEEVCDALNSSNVFAQLACGKITVKGVKYAYVARKYVEGERLSDVLLREICLTWSQASHIMIEVLKVIARLHDMPAPILHNDISPRNIIVSGSDYEDVCVIGTGHLSYETSGRPGFSTRDLLPLFMAPETSRRKFTQQTDIFSTGALLYYMLVGREPWCEPCVALASAKEISEARQKPLPHIWYKYGERLLEDDKMDMIRRMLALDVRKRYSDVREVLSDLLAIKCEERRLLQEKINEEENELFRLIEQYEQAAEQQAQSVKEPEIEKGFAEVAGLDNVKQLLTEEVLFVLKNPDKAQKYRLKAPNGMLFFGPPGCGKSYLAEKLSHEVQANFMMVKASDLGCVYVHGTQGKIKELFDEAREKAPSVICLDEIDGMVPDRTKVNNESAAGEVNEFLSQLNNCSERGIFVIGTTNRPNMIDPAILRSGRMDHMIYIPMPDLPARKEIFRVHLKNRPLSEDIDLDRLAELTEGYVASDIELIVNRTALKAAKDDVLLSQELLEDMIPKVRKSVTSEDNMSYENMKLQFESAAKSQGRKRIGFMTAG